MSRDFSSRPDELFASPTLQERKPSAYSVFIAVLTVLLILAIALFIYGSATNGIPQPHLPGKGVFALGTIIRHG